MALALNYAKGRNMCVIRNAANILKWREIELVSIKAHEADHS